MSGITYSFMDVAATLAGPSGVIDLGYGAGVAEEGVSIASSGDKNTLTIGADGSGMHSLHADRSGLITVRLLKVSPTNAKLMAAYSHQMQDSTNWGQNTIVISNPKSADMTTATMCAFKKRPDMAYKKDGDIVEWVFESVAIDSHLGTY